MITRSAIEEIYHDIRDSIFQTPLVFSPELSRISGAQVFLKMEHLQLTGSFKIRGVLSKLKSLHAADFDKPFVAASTGNHAAAFAYASEKRGFKGILYLPLETAESKIKAIEQYDVEKRFFGANSMETEKEATNHAKEINGILIHPYNDLEIIKGQGTLGAELEEQLDDIDRVLVPIGGGGLISGLACFFKTTKTKVIGCQPVYGAEMYESIQIDHIVPPSKRTTISDATSGGIEADALTFQICKKEISAFELIEEADIKKALAFLVKYHQTIVEPAAALPVAALLNSKEYIGQKVVLLLSGKKIDHQLLTEILNEYGDYY